MNPVGSRWKRCFLMNRAKSFLVWLTRIGHCRGFGIQSPTDYTLVRYVINEHWPYYKYKEIGLKDDWLTRKVGQLIFRLTNWCQPDKVSCYAYKDYVRAASSRVQVVTPEDIRYAKLVIVPASFSYLTELPSILADGTILLVDSIWHFPKQWKELVAQELSILTFDLYYCGIVIFDKKRTKQHYIVNF